MILSGYSYEIVYRKGTNLGHAETFSRLPTPQETEAETSSKNGENSHFLPVDELPVTSKEIRSATRRDPFLARVYDMTMTGRPDHVTGERLKPYWTRRHELSTEQGCVLWRTRVVIPSNGQPLGTLRVLSRKMLRPSSGTLQHLGACPEVSPSMKTDAAPYERGRVECPTVHRAVYCKRNLN